MKSFLVYSSTLLLLTVVGCGKKAKVDDGAPIDKIAPSTAEVYFNALQDMKKAVTNNDLKLAKKVVSENPGMDLNMILNDGETFLIMAIKKDFRDIRNFLLEKNVNYDQSNVNKQTPLIAAVNSNKLNSVRVLLDLKADLEKKDANGDTALHIAIKKSNDELATILIRQGANVEVLDRRDRNSLILARENNVPNSLDLIQTILKVEVGAPDSATFISILNNADLKRLTNVVQRFPSIVKDYEVLNPLAVLVDVKDEKNAIRSAELLIEKAANINGPKEAELTPLLKATLAEKKSFANLFLESNANPQLQDKDGKSALIHAVELNNIELVNMLLAHSAAEKYTIRKDGKRVTFNACETARKVETTLATPEKKAINTKIKESLDCGILRWLF
jgi:ankyrin repeat protein